MELPELTVSAICSGYRPTWLDSVRDRDALRSVAEQYRRMLLAVLLQILERYERTADYHMIDTKLDILTGEDFSADDPLRGRDVVYSWIQGRGLEALAGHGRWIAASAGLDDSSREVLLRRIQRMLREVMEKMEQIRGCNGGRLTFMMRINGRPLWIDDEGRIREDGDISTSAANYSDLFYAKGLAAAAAYLSDRGRLESAELMLNRAFADIAAGQFVSDQQPMDVKNPVRPVAGRNPQGPWMITIGAAELLLRLTHQPRYAEMGLRCIGHILHHHVKSREQGPACCQQWEMWEFVDDAGLPFFENGILRSDPGHATEFAGLSLKFLRTCRELGIRVTGEEQMADALRGVLRQNFANGFSSSGKGICKAFDLASRRAINTDMPWWSLPETIRAAMEAREVAGPDEKDGLAEIARLCSNAFMEYFVRPDRGLMANQTINAAGEPIATIPATPDADPGYHTGLSIIDALHLLECCLQSTP